MITEVCVGIIALAFVILTIFLILTLNKARKTLKHSIKLIDHLDHLAKDISRKSEALDVFFAPFHSKSEHGQTKNAIIVDSLKLLSDGVHLFNEVHNTVKGHGKKRKR